METLAIECSQKEGTQLSREVETRVELTSQEEQEALQQEIEAHGVEPTTAELRDTGYTVAGLDGRARVREVVPADGSPSYFEWTVKENVPDEASDIRSRREHQGRVETREEAEAALQDFLHELLGSEPVMAVDRVAVHTRTTYHLDNGVTVDIDVFTYVNGVLEPPERYVEFEILLPSDASPEELAEAAEKIRLTATLLGIHPSRFEIK